MNFRRTLTTPQARRCSAAAVAAAAAALMLTPGTALAASHPTGPGERPAGVGQAEHKHVKKSGHKNGRLNRHRTGSHRGGTHGGRGMRHGIAADDGSTGGATGGAGSDSGSGSDSGNTKPNSHSKAPKPGSRTPPKSSTPKNPKPGSEKSPSSGPMATVTKLSMSKNLTATRPLTMSARVSLAHRTAGAPKPTGTMTFTVDGASSGPIPLTTNRASIKVKVSPGKHTAAAKYSGDSSHSPSDSGPTNFTVS